MSVWLALVLLIVGIVSVIYGGDWFVKSSVSMAKRFKVPQVVIGATLVSIATTLPELIVSVISAVQGSYGLSVGNAVGTVVCNTALICGLCLTVAKTKFSSKDSKSKYFILLLVVCLLMVYSIDLTISLWESVSLVAITILFLVLNLIEARSTSNAINKGEVVADADKQDDNEELLPVWKMIFLFIIGAIGIGGGAYALVEGATALAQMIGISDEVIGLTIVGLGTSLPELVTGIKSVKKGNLGLSVGNIIGSNILNCTLIMGTCGLISNANGLPLSKLNFYVTIPLCIITSLILTLPIVFKKKTYRWQGIALLSLFVLYYIFLIISTIFGYFA